MADLWHDTIAVGLTGGIATGKSEVASLLRELGYWVADADQISRLVMAPEGEAYAGVVAHFGDKVLDENLQINRARLRQQVFRSSDDKQALEAIVHPAIARRLLRELEAQQSSLLDGLWFYEAALLVETGNYKKFHELWVTSCGMEAQVQRLMARDGCSAEQAGLIIAQQLPAAEKEVVASRVIWTETGRAELAAAVKRAVMEVKAVFC